MQRLVVGSAILALAAASLTGAWADDQEIARKVADRLKQEQKEGNLQGFDINLKVAEGKVTLKGEVSSAEQEDLAVNVTRQVEGVEDVINDLQVKAARESAVAGRTDSTASSGPARKSLFSGLLSGGPAKTSLSDASETAAAPSKAKRSDADLAQEIAAELKKAKDAGNLKGFDIDLSVKDSVAVLDGQVASDEQAQLVSRTARGIDGVREVVSRLVVAEKDNNLADAAKTSAKRATLGEPVLPPARYATAESKVSDVTASRTSGSKQTEEDRRIGDELTRRLQEAKQSGQLHGFGISVHVENGYVWLKGRVGSAAQRQMALDLARRTSGVRQVVNELSVAESAANIAQNLTGRLQSAEADGSLRGAKLNVKVDGPDVWLTGTVSKPQQEQLACRLGPRGPRRPPRDQRSAGRRHDPACAGDAHRSGLGGDRTAAQGAADTGHRSRQLVCRAFGLPDRSDCTANGNALVAGHVGQRRELSVYGEAGCHVRAGSGPVSEHSAHRDIAGGSDAASVGDSPIGELRWRGGCGSAGRHRRGGWDGARPVARSWLRGGAGSLRSS